MEVWYDPRFWFVWSNQIIALAAILAILLYLVKDLEGTRISLAFMAVINFLPAIVLAFSPKLVNINSGLLLMTSCLGSLGLLLGAFFSRLIPDYETGIKWASITPVFNSLAALFLVGALEIFTWPSLVLLGVLSVLLSVLCCKICNNAFARGEINAGFGS